MKNISSLPLKHPRFWLNVTISHPASKLWHVPRATDFWWLCLRWLPPALQLVGNCCLTANHGLFWECMNEKELICLPRQHFFECKITIHTESAQFCHEQEQQYKFHPCIRLILPCCQPVLRVQCYVCQWNIRSLDSGAMLLIVIFVTVVTEMFWMNDVQTYNSLCLNDGGFWTVVGRYLQILGAHQSPMCKIAKKHHSIFRKLCIIQWR